MQILITGATGFVGRALTKALDQLDRPYRVYAGRIDHSATLRQQLEGVTAVIHLAGAEATGRRRALQAVDVEGSWRLAGEARRAGVQHLIYLSRLNADPNSAFPLLRAKGEAERMISSGDVPYTIVRSASLYGQGDRFLKALTRLASWPIVWLPNSGLTIMQPLWVDDLVRCLLAALERPDLLGKTLALAGEERLSYRQIMGDVLKVTGRRRPLVPVRPILFRAMVFGAYGWRRRPPVSRFFLDRLTTADLAPTDSILYHFGFRPRPLSQNIAFLRR